MAPTILSHLFWRRNCGSYVDAAISVEQLVFFATIGKHPF